MSIFFSLTFEDGPLSDPQVPLPKHSTPFTRTLRSSKSTKPDSACKSRESNGESKRGGERKSKKHNVSSIKSEFQIAPQHSDMESDSDSLGIAAKDDVKTTSAKKSRKSTRLNEHAVVLDQVNKKIPECEQVVLVGLERPICTNEVLNSSQKDSSLLKKRLRKSSRVLRNQMPQSSSESESMEIGMDKSSLKQENLVHNDERKSSMRKTPVSKRNAVRMNLQMNGMKDDDEIKMIFRKTPAPRRSARKSIHLSASVKTQSPDKIMESDEEIGGLNSHSNIEKATTPQRKAQALKRKTRKSTRLSTSVKTTESSVDSEEIEMETNEEVSSINGISSNDEGTVPQKTPLFNRRTRKSTRIASQSSTDSEQELTELVYGQRSPACYEVSATSHRQTPSTKVKRGARKSIRLAKEREKVEQEQLSSADSAISMELGEKGGKTRISNVKGEEPSNLYRKTPLSSKRKHSSINVTVCDDFVERPLSLPLNVTPKSSNGSLSRALAQTRRSLLMLENEEANGHSGQSQSDESTPLKRQRLSSGLTKSFTKLNCSPSPRAMQPVVVDMEETPKSCKSRGRLSDLRNSPSVHGGASVEKVFRGCQSAKVSRHLSKAERCRSRRSLMPIHTNKDQIYSGEYWFLITILLHDFYNTIFIFCFIFKNCSYFFCFTLFFFKVIYSIYKH